MKILAYLILAAAILAGIGYSYRATYTAGDGNGYNRRVGEESKAYTDADAKGRKAQADADAATIAQYKRQADDANKAASDRQDRLNALAADKTTLTRRLHDLQTQSPDANRWLVEPIPADVLERVCWTSADPSTAADCPGH